MEPSEEMVEVYRCNSTMEADRAIVEVLEADGIEAYRRSRVSSSLPAPASEPGNYFIAVEASEAARAQALLEQALTDGVLDPDEGEVMGTEATA